MNILTIDTSTRFQIIGLSLNDGKTFNNSKETGFSHSNNLIENIDLCLKNAGIDIKDIDIFACGLGPGSFTGIRICVSTVRMLAQILNKPVLGVYTHDIIMNASDISNGDYIVAFDAKKKRVFGAFYKIENSKSSMIIEPGDYDIKVLLDEIQNKNVYFAGDAFEKYNEDILKIKNDIKYIENPIVNVSKLNNFIKDKFENKDENHDFKNLTPFYKRKSDAEVAKEAR